MAKRQYESKIAIQTRNFIDVKDQALEEPAVAPVVEAPQEKPAEKKTIAKDPKPAQTKKPTPVVKEEEKKAPESKPVAAEDDLVTEKVNDIIKSLIDSGQLQVKQAGKAGRPKKYEDETVLSSFRLTKTNYDYAYKMGRTKFASMTEYINHLIDEDINK